MKVSVWVVVCVGHATACASLPSPPPVQAAESIYVRSGTDPEPPCGAPTRRGHQRIWSATTQALSSCAHLSRQGIFIQGEYRVDVRASSDGRLSVESLGAASPPDFRSCFEQSLSAQRVDGFDGCVQTTLIYNFDSAVDLTNHATFIGSGERGEWVFRSPPAETPSFEVLETQGFATTSDARDLGARAFAGLETCFGDAVYSALADEGAFDLDASLEVRYVPRQGAEPEVQVLSAPSPGLASCTQQLDWPGASEHEYQHGTIRLRVEARVVLLEEIVDALVGHQGAAPR